MKTTIRIILSILFLFLLFGQLGSADEKTPAQADVLYLENGEEILGTFIESDDTTVRFLKLDKQELKVPVTQVQRIELAPSGNSANDISQLNDPDLVKWIEAAPTSEDFPGYKTATLFSGQEIEERKDGTIVEQFREVEKILNEKGKEAGNWKLSWYPDIEDLEIVQARSIGPDGNVSNLPHTAIKEASPFLRYPAYNRIKTLVFAIPNSEIGSVIDVKWRKVRRKNSPEMPWNARLHFAAPYPVLNKSISFKRPESSEIIFAKRNFNQGAEYVKKLQDGKKIYKTWPTGLVKQRTSTADGFIYTSWTAADLPIYIEEPNSPNWNDVLPFLLILKENKWTQIAKWFWEETNAKLQLDEQMQSYVDALTKNKDPHQAALDLYNDLVYKVDRIELPSWQSSYLPHSAQEIFKNGYANDWDKTFLYYAMAKEAGLNPQLLAVRPRNWDSWESKPPTISQFGYLLVRFLFEDGETNVICGSEYHPFGELSKSVWNGRTILLEQGQGSIGTLSGFSPEENEYLVDTTIRIDSYGNARIEEKSKWIGPIGFRQRQTWKIPEEILTRLFEKDVRQRHPNGSLVSFELSDRKNLDALLKEKVIYDATPIGSISSGRFIAFQLPGTNYSSPEVQENKRRFNLKLGGPKKIIKRFEIIAPEGCSLVGLPDAISIHNRMGTFTRTVQSTGTGAIIEDATELKAYSLPVELYDDYFAYMTTRQKAGSRKVILEVKTEQ